MRLQQPATRASGEAPARKPTTEVCWKRSSGQCQGGTCPDGRRRVCSICEGPRKASMRPPRRRVQGQGQGQGRQGQGWQEVT
eukprot:446159-Alexandrium_andersonii.AAC.1